MHPWPLAMFIVCGSFTLVFIRIWVVAYSLHRVREWVNSLTGRQYIDAAIWYDRIRIGRMIIQFWRRPSRMLDEPNRAAYLTWRRRATWWGTPP
jgi:hypothetical protein